MPTTLNLRPRRISSRVLYAAWLLLAVLVPCCVFGQSESASVSGRVTDQQNAVIPNVEVEIRNVDTNSTQVTKTNGDGIYTFASLRPGNYVMSVRKEQFQTVSVTGVTLNVQDNLSRNFVLQVGSSAVSVTVTADDLHMNTTDASVSTVVDRQFAENLPMNGRSFQTLIELTPGVVVTPTGTDAGQFSVNGQRPSSNYWMVDGVGANVGISATNSPGNGLGGALGSFSAMGGTNSLVSVDAMQEFRIQTSTYAPEFGRSPGAQISIVTRSGTNEWHGTIFDYLRNDALDANDWFAANAKLQKPQERQNDFGGTVGGPIFKSRTFFFFSYEGLRLRLPRVALDTVPDLAARQNAVPAMQPFLNAFPLDPNQPDLGNGIAQYNASYSNSAHLDAYSLRIDHKLNSKWSLFARYNYSPSEILARGTNDTPLSVVTPTHIRLQTATGGATWIASSAIANDLRVNYSSTRSTSSQILDNFGGAVPLTNLPFPSPFSVQDSFINVAIFGLKGGQQLTDGKIQRNLQRQINIVDGLSVQTGRHSLKVGVDYRRLSPLVEHASYAQFGFFFTVPSAQTGSPFASEVQAAVPFTLLFRSIGAYAQDTWRATDRMTLTYGLRWDVDFAPSTLNGPNFPAATGYNLKDLSQLALAPVGTTPFHTTFNNFAPRVGVAYQLLQKQNWQTVLRGGFGVFYDLASSTEGTMIGANYPFLSDRFNFGGTYPVSSALAAAPPITAASLICCGNLTTFDPHLKLPYTLQWNVALEQGIGSQQSLSATYVGASGRRLLQSAFVLSPNPNLSGAVLVANTAASNYNALQLQFQRRLNRGLQALASYTWSHSVDDGSAGSTGLESNTLIPALGSRVNRGPSDFDIRHSFSTGLTYNIPVVTANSFGRAILGNWSVQSFVIAFSAPPVDVSYGSFAFGGLFNSVANVRPDVVPGQSFYLSGSQCLAVLGPPCAGGKGFNSAAFTSPPLDPVTGNPLRQGNLSRNALRGFGAFQWDLGVHREFPIHERLKLEFRAELFNVLNHPNFGPPVSDLDSPQSLNPQFGQAQFMLGQSLSGAGRFGNVGNGSFDPLYQIGGPRTAQLALKLSF